MLKKASLPIMHNDRIDPRFIIANRQILQNNIIDFESFLSMKNEISRLWLREYNANLNFSTMQIEFESDAMMLKFLLKFS